MVEFFIFYIGIKGREALKGRDSLGCSSRIEKLARILHLRQKFMSVRAKSLKINNLSHLKKRERDVPTSFAIHFLFCLSSVVLIFGSSRGLVNPS